ncbi:hypothetical protein [Cesiribacter andamanensis]|uniref:Uncharacterized protein n=1 Tax=Cesiribacter andamanensis AMV16 TaxID=1279009 RepID=M7N5H4_9BACT|nr:hypothetical protein [Cesiribacter andamanensis]EMR02542.1 hypothetical protein ADICEAN_02351 [Cesiribacter andamanensis AMV16]
MPAVVLLLILSLPLLGYGQSAETITEISFTTGTRGSQQEIRITPSTLHIAQKGRGGDQEAQHPLTAADWQQLLGSLQGLSLKEMEQLPAPSEKRAWDGAYYSWISISTPTKSYTSQHFDDRSPHPKLLPLMREIERLEQAHSSKE